MPSDSVAGALRRARRWLYLAHRWLGIGVCLLFVLWFVSGLVMMYVRVPALDDAEAQAGLAPIVWQRIQLGPDAALAAAGLTAWPRELRLQMLLDEPVYRLLDWDGSRSTWSAVDGRAITAIDADAAATIAARFGNANPLRQQTLDYDLWTAHQRFATWRPLHRIRLDDAAGTDLYVSSRTGEVVLDTRRWERFWNRLGVGLHYLYFAELRAHAPLWRQMVLWVSGIGMAVAFSGTVIGVLRMRLKRRYKGGRISPYRGWMARHHLGGLAGGVVICTWIFSGWLSMGPNPWPARAVPTQAMLEAYAGHDQPRFGLAATALQQLAATPAREARFQWLGGQPLLLLADADARITVLDGASLQPHTLDDVAIFTAARRLLPGAELIAALRLETEDSYWYSHHRSRPLPVLRAVFDDERRSWFHLDPATGQLLAWLDQGGRQHRWLFNALHSFDIGWLRQRPLWDMVLWALSLAGLTVSISGVVVGWRRLRR